MENKYAAPHVWNLAAKIIRENYPVEPANNQHGLYIRNVGRRAVEDIALAFAQRFIEDEGFDPHKFLDQCSPDTDLYPLTELWR